MTGNAGSLVVAVALVLAGTVAAAGGLGTGTSAGIADQFEPNDDFGSATVLTPPFTTETADIDGGDDEDFYAVDLQSGDRLNVTIEFDHDRGDIDLVVLDPNRDRLAESLSFSDDENASIQAGTTGTYYIYVAGFTENTTAYTLSIDRSAGSLPSNDEFEYNDGFGSSTRITTPFDRSDLRLAPGDIDVYAVEGKAGERLNVTARFSHAESDVELRLYGPNQDLLTLSVSSTDNESLSAPIRQAGRYYVEVDSADDGATSYALNVTLVQDESGNGYSDPLLDGYDGDNNGRIDIGELGQAGLDFANGVISIAEYGRVAIAFANS